MSVKSDRVRERLLDRRPTYWQKRGEDHVPSWWRRLWLRAKGLTCH